MYANYHSMLSIPMHVDSGELKQNLMLCDRARRTNTFNR